MKKTFVSCFDLFRCSLVACVLTGSQALSAAEPGAVPGAAEALRAAIEDLEKTFGTNYPRGREFRDRLAKRPAGDVSFFDPLRREALLENPLVSGVPILFVCRAQYRNVHGPDETMCQKNECEAQAFLGGAQLKVLAPAAGTTRTLLSVPDGIARDPCVSFDGKRILFSMRRNASDDYHLYEMDADGRNVRQLTCAPDISDIQPVYLPNGNIMFSSTREPKYIHCQRHLMASLFLMDGDGANIRQVGFNTLFEGRGSLLPDGRVLYSRWEYVDKHFSSAYGLWTANPDGTSQSLLYGGLSWQPGAMLDARAVPGTSRLVCIFGSVHDNDWGAMVLVDPAAAPAGPETWARSWPRDIRPMLAEWNNPGRSANYDSFIATTPKYATPYPLSDKYFLCSRMLDARNGEMGIFLVDVFGNELLLHREAPGCFQPMPLAARPAPPIIAERANPRAEDGTVYVVNVYDGDAMRGVRRGAVRALRIVEATDKRTYPAKGVGDWAAPGDAESHHPTAVSWNQYNSKRILGTVPVEADGSAYFRMPAGRFVYFQLLDENGMMIQSMRSGTSVLPGEASGCAGCHTYRSAPQVRGQPLALRRAPSVITPWHGPERNFNFAAEVQPVLDRHCLACHDYGRPAAAKAALAGDQGLAFNASYVALMARSPALWTPAQKNGPKPLISTIGVGPIPVVPPYSWGSSRSRLVDMLRAGHHEAELSPEELDRIVSWIDLNAPYYGVAEDYYSANTWGRSPLNHQKLLRLGQLVGAAPGGSNWGWRSVTDYGGGGTPPGSLMASGELPVNFTRPEWSACLQAFADKSAPEYAEALALIREGQVMLAEHPRADMPGFLPCEEDRRRLDFWQQRQLIDQQSWHSLRENRKAYDTTGRKKE